MNRYEKMRIVIHETVEMFEKNRNFTVKDVDEARLLMMAVIAEMLTDIAESLNKDKQNGQEQN